MAKKMGRPKTEIDKEMFIKMCQFMCTEEDLADYFNCSVDTICNWCKKTYNKTFSEVYKKESQKGKVSLRNAMYKNAIKNNNSSVQIFLAKNQLGMKDKQDVQVTGGVNIVYADTDDKKL